MRIMIVEDEPASSDYLCEIIRKFMPEASVCALAENGEEALEKAPAAQPDVVITDINMPHMDGLALTAALRRHDPGISVVIVSGYQEFEYARMALRNGVSDYLLKPVKAQELVRALRECAKACPAPHAQPASSHNPFHPLADYVAAHLAEPITLSMLCRACGVSQTTANRIFRRYAGKSFLEYLTARRIERARALLSSDPHMLIKNVAASCGFCDPLYFSKVFKTAVGCSPTEYAERQD